MIFAILKSNRMYLVMPAEELSHHEMLEHLS